MNNIIRLNIYIICLIIFSLKVYSTPLSDTINSCKDRLPNEINSYQPILVPVLTPDGKRLYFDRKSHPKNTNKVKDFDDIWYSDRLSQDKWTEPINLTELNTIDSDVLFWISPDGRTGLVYGIYSGFNNQKIQGFSLTEFDGDKWSKPVPLNIKNFYNDSLHFYANLSADGKILIIAVSRKDAFGGLDLYASFLNDETHEWSLPMNMGSDINTKGDEEAPYLAFDNKTLYFSSDGLKGEGEQDLYYSRRLDDSWKNWSKPQNLGKGINTKYGEQGFCLNATGDSAIIVSYDTVSKRKGLYWICMYPEKKPEPYTIVSGNINIENIDSQTNEVNIYVNDKIYQKVHINKLKNYSVILSYQKKCTIRAEAKGLSNDIFDVDLRNINNIQIINHDFTLKQLKTLSDNITVYFAKNSYILDEQSLEILNKLISRNIGNSKIEIFGHADETGTEDYNMLLSLKRAKHIREYLINKGLKRTNIICNAKGEKEPISDDFNMNRKAEIIIK